MRCKRHNTDLSSIDGVCASCLRERLFRLILAQEQAQAQSIEPNQCNSVTNPTLRRSVSPYISRVESVNSVNPIVTVQRPHSNPRLNHSQSDKRFYSSPQIAISTGGCIGGRSNCNKQRMIRFPSISNLFRSNSRNGHPDLNRCESESEPCGGGGGGRLSSVTSSRSWFSNVLPGAGVRQKSKGLHIDEASTAVVQRRRCFRDRGMSPVRFSDDEFSDGTSDCQSAESCKQTPMKTPVRRGGGGQKSVTELIFCSLVHASPNRLLNMNVNVKGKPPVSGGFSGDSRAPAVPHLAYTKSFAGNRSRKLADFGRCDLNR